jgi:hypothetical protein
VAHFNIRQEKRKKRNKRAFSKHKKFFSFVDTPDVEMAKRQVVADSNFGGISILHVHMIQALQRLIADIFRDPTDVETLFGRATLTVHELGLDTDEAWIEFLVYAHATVCRAISQQRKQTVRDFIVESILTYDSAHKQIIAQQRHWPWSGWRDAARVSLRSKQVDTKGESEKDDDNDSNNGDAASVL